MYIHVDIFHYIVLSLKMNLVSYSQIFYKKYVLMMIDPSVGHIQGSLPFLIPIQ